MKKLELRIEKIANLASQFGLDCYPIHFELCPSETLYTVGAYGIPTRFNHWSFGKNFYRLKTQYDYGLHKIYELVINSNPCYAFVLENISLVEQTIVAAHVYGHSDFFKNNIYTRNEDQDILTSMEINRDRILTLEDEYGKDQVEKILDACLALKNCVGNGDGDLLQYIYTHSQNLFNWQRDILMMLINEIQYFKPLRMTKIINEGWAVFWHSKIIRDLGLSAEDYLEFARLQGNLLQTNKFSINPYLIGLKIFTRLEKSMGMEAIFEIRKTETDLSFIRNYLSNDLLKDLDLYIYGKKGNKWIVIENDQEEVKERFLETLINEGNPLFKIKHDDLKGELYLEHSFDKWELDQNSLKKTLQHVFTLWGEKVYLQTEIDGKKVQFSYDSNGSSS